MNAQFYYRLIRALLSEEKAMPPHCDRETVIYSDEIFINAGDPISSLFILIKGNVKIKSVSTSGDNAIIASLSAPQILGITEFLRRMDTFGASGKPSMLMEKFGFTVANVVATCKGVLNK